MSQTPSWLVRRRRRSGHAGHQFDSLRAEEDLQVRDGPVQHDRDAGDLKVDVQPDDREILHQVRLPEAAEDGGERHFQD